MGAAKIKSQFAEDLNQLQKAMIAKNQSDIDERCAELSIDFIGYEFLTGITNTVNNVKKPSRGSINYKGVKHSFLASFNLKGKLCGEVDLCCDKDEKIAKEIRDSYSQL